jgi:RNA polymerase sigma-70 factor (ECF subfamily)
MLRSRKSRREESFDTQLTEATVTREDGTDPEHQALLADSVGLALLVVLETLAPAERVAFVLHDLFAMPFDEIAPIVGRSPAAARQLASRARRRVQGTPAVPDADLKRRREVIDAFLAASRAGDFGALLALLDPEVVLRADEAAVQMGASKAVRGAAQVAQTFSGRARAAQPALVNGDPGLVWVQHGRPRTVFGFTITRDKIVEIQLLADPERLRKLELAILND